MRRGGAFALVALLACRETDDPSPGETGASDTEPDSQGGQTEGDSQTDGAADTDRPSPYTGGGSGTDEMPTMGPDEAVATAMTGLRTFVFMDPQSVIDAFVGMEAFEDGCPEDYTDVVEGETRVLQWYTEGCTTSGGLEVRGGGQLQLYAGRVEGDRTSSGAVLSADGGTFRLEQGGRWMQFSGYLAVDRGTYAAGSDGYFGLYAEASADAQTAGDSPLLDGSLRAQGEIYAGVFPDYRALGGSGAVTGSTIGTTRATSFDDVLLVAEVCGTEPAGTVAVRDDLGFWHDILFDVGTLVGEEYEWNAAECDGCGAYLAGGENLGEACAQAADVGPILDWQEVPW